MDKTEAGVSSECVFVSSDFLMELVTLVVKNAYVEFGGRYFKTIIGFPIGTNSGRELAGASLSTYNWVSYDEFLLSVFLWMSPLTQI